MKTALITCILFTSFWINAQIPNPGFERWIPGPMPADWKVNSNPLTLPPWDPYVVRQDSPAISGRYAVNIQANGFINGQARTKFKLNSRPNTFSFFYKSEFAPCVNDVGFPDADTVSVEILFFNQGLIVHSVRWETLQTQMNYTEVGLPLNLPVTPTDSCEIILTGGKVIGGCGIIAAPTRFFLDSLRLLPEVPPACIDLSVIDSNMVCLGVFDPVCGCDSVTYVNSCEAYYRHGVTSWVPGACASDPNPYCEAFFSFSKQKDTVSFQSSLQGAILISQRWTFGDGDSSTAINPVHVFPADGTYQVCLYMEALGPQGQYCADTFCRDVFVTTACIDSSLICQPPHLCCDAPLFDPVCGCDGETYDNACIALLLNGVTSTTPGSCQSTGYAPNIRETIKIIPNPATDYLQVSNLFAIRKVCVYNFEGRSLLENNNSGEPTNSVNIDIPNFESGIYLLGVLSQSGVWHYAKFIVR